MGSLGFLTNFDFESYEKTLQKVIKGPNPCVLRSRIKCEIIRSKLSENKTAICKEALAHEFYLSEIYGSAMRLPEACVDDETNSNPESPYNTLNEIVVHRGLSPYLLNLKLYVNGKAITYMQGDGLLISTPTGSTAYAMSAGATMLHPSVPAIMITPVNPHTLNCRPICLPTNSIIELELASNSSSMTAHVNCDGQTGGYSLLAKGDRLRITSSEYPIPCICSESQVSDWFSGLAQCLHWNVRHVQSEFNHSRFTDSSVENVEGSIASLVIEDGKTKSSHSK